MNKSKIIAGLALCLASVQAFASNLVPEYSKPAKYKSQYDKKFVEFLDGLESKYRKDLFPVGNQVFYHVNYSNRDQKELATLSFRQYVQQKFTDEDRTDKSISEIATDLRSLSQMNCGTILEAFNKSGLPKSYLEKIAFKNEQYLTSGDEFITIYQCRESGEFSSAFTYVNPNQYRNDYDPQLVKFLDAYTNGININAKGMKVISRVRYFGPSKDNVMLVTKMFVDENNPHLLKAESGESLVEKITCSTLKEFASRYGIKDFSVNLKIVTEVFFSNGDSELIQQSCYYN